MKLFATGRLILLASVLVGARAEVASRSTLTGWVIDPKGGGDSERSPCSLRGSRAVADSVQPDGRGHSASAISRQTFYALESSRATIPL